MKSFDTVGYIMEYEEGSLSARKTLDLFAHLIKTGQAWSLQGSYGRTASALIESNWISKAGVVNKNKVKENGL